MIRCALAVLIVGLSALLAGCSNPAFSLRPLYLPKEKPAAEPRLEGEWAPFMLRSSGVSREDERWTITAQSDGCYRGERRKKDPENEQEEHENYRVCLVATNDKLFFDEALQDKNVGRQMVGVRDMTPEVAPLHMVGRLWVQQDFVRLTRLKSDWVKANQPEELQETIGNALVFTGSTQQLRDIMTHHSEDHATMSSAWYLCRPAVDCSPQVVQDELQRDPNDMATLSGAAQFYAGREDYDRAIALTEKIVALTPPDSEGAASVRYDLGVSRLLKRDFSGARVDFAAAAAKDKTNQLGRNFFTGVSYFMEGNYAEAHKTFAALPDSSPAMVVILDYASLSRTGRNKQAESFFSDRMLRFAGEQDEQLLLLRAAGRVKDFSPDKFTEEELARGDGALYAIVRLTKGDRNAARQVLEATVAKVGKGDPVYVGAKIELERLNASEPKSK